MKKKKILFICWGNIHRSPLAAEFFKREATQYNYIDQIDIENCGLQGFRNNPKPQYGNFSLYPEYEKCCEFFLNKGIDFSKQSSQPITKKLIKSSDLIIAMDKKIIEDISYGLFVNFPDAQKKTILFSEISEGEDIADPYMSKEKNAYINTAISIEGGIKKGFKNIISRLQIN